MQKKEKRTTTARHYDKDKKYLIQKNRVYEALCEYPQTSLMLEQYTGIFRANINRHIAELERENKIMAVDKRLCKISKHRAKYYSAIRELF